MPIQFSPKSNEELQTLDERTEMPPQSNAQPSLAAPRRFERIAIPDIREQLQQSAEQFNLKFSPVSEPERNDQSSTSHSPLSSLEAIKASIEERISEDEKGGVAVIDHLKTQIDSLQIPINEHEVEIEIPGNQTTDPASDQNVDQSIVKSAQEKVKDESCLFSRLDLPTESIGPSNQQILEEFPPEVGAIISLSQTEDNPKVNEIIAAMCVDLQNRSRSKILFIDSRLGQTDLEFTSSGGVVATNRPNQDPAIHSTSHPKIDLLISGQIRNTNDEKIKASIKKTVSSVKNSYDYIVVFTGDAHGFVSDCWSTYSQASYVFVSLSASNRHIAKSAVARLAEQRSRLIGCILTDVSAGES